MIYQLLLALMFLSSCKDSKKLENQDDPLFKEVMEIHNNVMPELSTIHAIKRDLKAIESPESKEIILAQIKNLDEADEAMMTWMADFKVPDNKSKEKEYLEAQKLKISHVSDLMYSSIKNGNHLLDSLKSKIIK